MTTVPRSHSNPATKRKHSDTSLMYKQVLERKRIRCSTVSKETVTHPPKTMTLLQQHLNQNETVELPSPIWAKVMDYMYFDEAVQVSSVNNFFSREVAPLVKHAMVRNSCCNWKTAGTCSGLFKRFSGVQRIFFYSLISELRPGYEILDKDTMEYAIPFVSQFPKLKSVLFSGLSSPSSSSESSAYMDNDCFRYNHFYSVDSFYINISKKRHQHLMGRLLLEICHAYQSGALAPTVEVLGLVQRQTRLSRKFQKSSRSNASFSDKAHSHALCAYKALSAHGSYSLLSESNRSLGSSTRNNECPVCHNVCRTFPPSKVLRMHHDQVPCVGLIERFQIVNDRIPIESRSRLLTDTLLDCLSSCAEIQQYNMPSTNPSDSWPSPTKARTVTAIDYSDESIQLMAWLVDQGANVHDPRIHSRLLQLGDCCSDHSAGGIHSKQQQQQLPIMTKKIFSRMVQLGFQLSSSDLHLIIDTSNPLVTKMADELDNGRNQTDDEDEYNYTRGSDFLEEDDYDWDDSESWSDDEEDDDDEKD